MALELVRLFPPVAELIELDQRLPQQFAGGTNFGRRSECKYRCKPFATMLQLCQWSFDHFAPSIQEETAKSARNLGAQFPAGA